MRNPKHDVVRNVRLTLVACLLLAGPVLAQASANHDLSWHIIAGGGGRLESTGHTMWATLSQPLVGTTASSDHWLCSGFWCLQAGHQIYLPVLLRGT